MTLKRLLQRWRSRPLNYVQQVQAWGASDPVIPPLKLPAVQPLKAVTRGFRARVVGKSGER